MEQFDVRADGLLRVDDGFRGEGRVVTADAGAAKPRRKSASARKCVPQSVWWITATSNRRAPAGLPRGEVSPM